MAKKRSKRTSKKQRGWLVPKEQVNTWLNQASDQILQGDYDDVVKTCQRILRYAPAQASERAEALEYMASATMMLKRFEDTYQVLSQALAIAPQYGRIWYNRALSGRLTLRLVQAVDDLEKAIELETDPELRKKYSEVLSQTRELAERDRALRGPDFTMEELREQHELFNQGLQLMQTEQWAEAEQTFRRVIEMSDCLPQPNGNLGLALLMQRRYDEAEAAFERALELDPDYDLARHNLAALPHIRETGKIPKFLMRDPFAEAKISLDVQIDED